MEVIPWCGLESLWKANAEFRVFNEEAGNGQRNQRKILDQCVKFYATAIGNFIPMDDIHDHINVYVYLPVQCIRQIERPYGSFDLNVIEPLTT
ncbi:hypothetical protein TNCV_1224881 [Trichonephila clavipes]|nr:hypothetical protein TNCV_1224881 [Trichonephila clavipes]